MHYVDSKTVVLSVIYKKITKFLPEFILSLEKQTEKNFNLLIANDGVINPKKYFANSKLKYHIKNFSYNPIEIRIALIKEAIKKNYTRIIFLDADDICAKNRIEVIIRLLNSHQVVINDIDLINHEGRIDKKKYFSQRIKNNDEITYSDIIDYNLCGLTNTAAVSEVFKNLKILNNKHSLNLDKPIAFDWIIWSLVLQNGHKSIFTNETTTKYRIYDQNIVGFPNLIDDNKIKLGIDVKYSHFKYLRNYEQIYDQEFKKILAVKRQMNNSEWKQKYLRVINDKISKKQLWWEFVLTSI